MEQLLAQLIGGAIGGLGGGKAVKSADVGNVGNGVLGAIGGWAGGSLLNGLMRSGTEAAASAGGVDIASMLGNLVGGGVSGLIVQVVAGLVIKRFMA
jgi:hypothetical protein